MEKLAIKFNKEIIPKLKAELKLKNTFEVPRITKVVVSSGVGDYKEDKNAIAKIAAEIAKITGQKAKLNSSRIAISAFKLRIGQPIGLTTTLRGNRMYDFIDKLVNVTLPRVRDFRGLKLSAFDNKGNYSIGIRDYTIFPEVKFEDVSIVFGLGIYLNIKANNSDDANALLIALGFPFEKGKK